MPTLQLKISPLQNPSRYRALAEALTRITGEQLGKRAEVKKSRRNRHYEKQFIKNALTARLEGEDN